MKILFVFSGNHGIDPISTNQGKSLEKTGLEVSYYAINGKGVLGYLKNIRPLLNKIKTFTPDIIHAHYSYCGILSTIVNRKIPIIVSLMGTDVIKPGFIFKWLVNISIKYYWKKTIVKSDEMYNILNNQHIAIIPNGVDIALFKHIEISEAQKFLGWEKDKVHILFCASPDRIEKNYKLAKTSIDCLTKNTHNFTVETHYLHKISPEEVPLYLSSSHVLLLTSKYEGSPNVIKEAMACNCPIISTDVGDAKKVIGNTEGCFITSFKPEDIAEKIKKAIEFAQTKGRTNGRKRLIELGLDSESVANKISDIYNNILEKK
jgi:teichuronic acid biosynthesis glycosyltransferase TuaC